MPNHVEPRLSNLGQNARFSAVFGEALVGPAGLQKASLYGETIFCLTFPTASLKALGDPLALSNLFSAPVTAWQRLGDLTTANGRVRHG